MEVMKVAEDTFQAEISPLKEEAPLNMKDISVTFKTSQLWRG